MVRILIILGCVIVGFSLSVLVVPWGVWILDKLADSITNPIDWTVRYFNWCAEKQRRFDEK